MDARLKSYVVMKAVEMIHGKRGKTSVVKLLKGSHEYGVEKMVQEFDLISSWGVFFRLDKEEIEGILSTLMEKGFIYSEEVQSGVYSYPMLHISDEGRSVLLALEETEPIKLRDARDKTWEDRRVLEISNKGMMLDGFLADLTSFLQIWGNSAYHEYDFTELLNTMELEFAERERLEKFIYRVTPDKLQDRFRNRYAIDTTCYHLTKHMRELLGALTELESMIFRCHYNVQDMMQKPVDYVLKYYGVMEKDVQGVIKRLISRFSNRSYMERFTFIQLVMAFMDELAGDTGDNNDPLVKETTTVTYELYKEGLPINDIAKERGLAVSTIYTHFTKLIPEFKINLDDIIPKDRLSCILQAMDATGAVSLKAIKEQLAPDYNYGEIKLVLELQKGWQAA
ncbi:MAG: helix-turn-helix domain-containing protein [Firmicutes bacterium]|nr:helix-turn-helix domain-containing protein [Bacillota bacterium]